jgi:hypothetical protein
MKKLFIVLFACFSIVACTTGDKKSKEKMAGDDIVKDSIANAQKMEIINDTANYTTIKWLDSTYRNFGKVKEGEALEVSFRFINTGDKNLIISDVRPGCGCTDGQKPEEPIAPGKEGVIKAKFNSKGQHIGEARKNITVTANTKPSPTTVLEFTAEVTN